MTQEKSKENQKKGIDTDAQKITPKSLDNKAAYLMVAMGQANMSRERAEALLLTDKNNE